MARNDGGAAWSEEARRPRVHAERKPIALVFLGARAEAPHIRSEWLWRSGHGDVVLVALTPVSGHPILQCTRYDDRPVHERLLELIAERLTEEMARLSLARTVRELTWPDRRGGRGRR